MNTALARHPTTRPDRIIRVAGGVLLATALTIAQAAIDPGEKAERWWDASRADRIGFSDRAATACKSPGCDSLQIRSCLNDTLKPPTASEIRSKTIGEIAARCIARLQANR